MILQPGTLSQKQKRLIILFGLAALLLILLISPAFATSATSTIETEVKRGAGSVYNLFKAILAPIAVVVVVWNVFKALFLGERGMEGAKKGILITLCIVVIVYLAPVIVTNVAGWFSSVGDQGVFSTTGGGGTGGTP